MKDVFISYAHEDRETAQRLAGLLEAAGLTVWWDPQLRAGEDFAKIIEQTLQQVRCVIVLWSKDSVESHWVRAEAGEGLRLEKLVPVLLDGSTPPLIFRALHTVRLEGDDLYADSPGLQKLIDDVRARIGEAASPHPVATAARWTARWRRLLPGITATLVAIAAVGWSGLAARALDVLTGWLGAISGLSPFTVEITVALAALVALAVLVYRSGHGRTHAAVFVLAFVFGSIGYAWVERWLAPPPDHLFGRVVAEATTGLGVTALDAAGREMALQAVPVGSQDGTFGMRLRPAFADRPRVVVVGRPGCREVRQAIDWETWRERRDVVIEFNCN